MFTNEVPAFETVVTPLDAVKRRRRVDHLLYTRRRLAELSAQYRAHDVDQSLELYTLQLAVEQTIADDFPVEFEVHVSRWAEEEAFAEHHPSVSAEECGLCEAIANARTSQTRPPRAA